MSKNEGMKNNSVESPVIVIGGNHHNTFGVLRALGSRGVNPYLVLLSTRKTKLFVQSSRYVKKNYVANNEEEVVSCLKKIASNFIVKPIVICTSDEASHVVDTYIEGLRDGFQLPNAIKAGRITELMDKGTITQLAKQCGLQVPITWIAKQSEIDNVSYPCIVKPLASYNSSKSDIHIFYTRDELNSLYKTKSDCFLIQEYVDRDFEFQLIGCSLNSGKEVIIPGYTKIIRSSDKTNTGVLTYQEIDFPLEIDKCKMLMQETGYSGLFSMEFIRDKKGKNYFLEINFRNDGNAVSVTASGVNLPYIWYLYNSGKEYKEETQKKVKKVKIMPIFDDYVHFVRTKKIGVLQWLKEMFSIDCFMDFYFWDQVPFWRQVFHI